MIKISDGTLFRDTEIIDFTETIDGIDRIAHRIFIHDTTYEDVAAKFTGDFTYSTYFENPVYDEVTGEAAGIQVEEHDCSDYNIYGKIVDYRDGTVSVECWKVHELESALDNLVYLLFGEE